MTSLRRPLTILFLCLPLLSAGPSVQKRLSREELDNLPRDFNYLNATYESCCTTRFYWNDDGDFTWGDERDHYELEFYEAENGNMIFDPIVPDGTRTFALHVLENHKADFHAGRDYTLLIRMGELPHDRHAITFTTPDIPPVSNLVATALSPTSVSMTWEPFHFDGCQEEKWYYIVRATHDGGIGPHAGQKSDFERPIDDCDPTQVTCTHVFDGLLPGHHYEFAMYTVYDATESGQSAYANLSMPFGAGDLNATVDNPCLVKLDYVVDFEVTDFIMLTIFDETDNVEMDRIPLLAEIGANTFHLDVLEREKIYLPGHTFRATLQYHDIVAETTFETLFFPHVDLHTVEVADTFVVIDWHPFHFEGCQADHWVYVFKITHNHWGNLLPEFPIQDCNVLNDLCVHKFDGLWACAAHEVTVHPRYRDREFSQLPHTEAAFNTTRNALRAPIITNEYYTYNHTVHLEWSDPENFEDSLCEEDETFFYKVMCEVNNLPSCIVVTDDDFVPRHYLTTNDRYAEIQLRHPYADYTCHIQSYSSEALHGDHAYDYTSPAADIDFKSFPEISPPVVDVEVLSTTLTSNSATVRIERPNCMYFDYIDGIEAAIENVRTGDVIHQYFSIMDYIHPDISHYEFVVHNLTPNTIYSVTARVHTLPGFGEWSEDAYDIFQTKSS